MSTTPLNNSLPSRPTPSSSGWASSVFQTCIKRPWDYACHWVNPKTNPDETLKRIGRAAEQGLRRASVRGVQMEPTHLQRDLDLLVQANHTRSLSVLNAAEVGPVIDPSDVEMTKPPRLQARVDATDWKKEIRIHYDNLTRKLSAFTALIQMRDGCGVDIDNLTLMDLVKRATEGENPASVWTLFASHVNLTFFQKLKAAWFYWFYYQTSLITNTVDAYLGAFIDRVKTDLENNQTRSRVFSSLLKNANQFLIADIQSTKKFAYEQEAGDLEDCQNRAIESLYNFSLSDLCQAFTIKQIEEVSPRVRFFKGFQGIPIIGWAFQGFEWFVNRFIIQSNMKKWILPQALESAVIKGLEAAQPQNLPFSLSMTRFFNGQLEKLLETLETGPVSFDSVERFPGTEMLPPVIKNLKMALALESLKTPLELRKKFEEIEKDGKWLWDKAIEESIEGGIVDAGDLLFNYLNDIAESGELFAYALELSCAPFSGEVQDPEILKAEYVEEQLKLQRTATNAFREIVRRSVARIVSSPVLEDSTQVAESSFDAQKVVTSKTVEELSILCRRMELKIAQSNNVHSEIASFLQVMQVFANRKELQEKIREIKGVDQNAIWGILGPLFDRIAALQEQILRLQELQDDHLSDTAANRNLNDIQESLASIRDQLNARPQHWQNPFTQTLAKSVSEIVKCLGAKAPISIKLQESIHNLSSLLENVSKEQKIIDALHALYPPRVDANMMGSGLLDQLIAYARGEPPSGFRLSHCIQEIRKHLAYLPQEECDELTQLVGDGSNLRAILPDLRHALQRIYVAHVAAKMQGTARFNAALDETSQWTKEKALKYARVKEQDHAQMREVISQISQGLSSLTQAIQKAELSLPKSVSKRGIQAIGWAAPAALGYLGGSLLGPIGTLVGGALGGVAGKCLTSHSESDQPQPKTPLQKTLDFAAGPAIAAGSYFFLPGLSATLGEAVGTGHFGWQATKTAQTAFEKRVFDQVWEIFTNAYGFTLVPRVYKAAMTRTMKAMIEPTS